MGGPSIPAIGGFVLGVVVNDQKTVPAPSGGVPRPGCSRFHAGSCERESCGWPTCGRNSRISPLLRSHQTATFNAANESEIDTAFAGVAQLGSRALLVGSDPYFNSRREQIVALAARHGIPAVYEWREFAQAGGMMSYGTNLVDAYRQLGTYAGRILKGETRLDRGTIEYRWAEGRHAVRFDFGADFRKQSNKQTRRSFS
jgi:hypothetical protein